MKKLVLCFSLECDHGVTIELWNYQERGLSKFMRPLKSSVIKQLRIAWSYEIWYSLSKQFIQLKPDIQQFDHLSFSQFCLQMLPSLGHE